MKASLESEIKEKWELTPYGLAVPTTSIRIDMAKINLLFSMVMKGLFNFHFNEVLDPDWFFDVAIIDPQHEDKAIVPMMRYFRSPYIIVEGNLGRGTFVYRGMRSREIPAVSLWQFNLFGEMRLGGAFERPGASFTKFSAVSRPSAEAVARIVEKNKAA